MYRISRLIFFCIFSSFASAQEDSTYYYFDEATPIENIQSKIKNTKNPLLNSYYSMVYFSKLRNTDSITFHLKNIDVKSLPRKLYPRFIYLKAYCNKILDNDSLAYIYHKNAFEQASKLKDTLTILYSLSGLSQSWDYIEKNSYRLYYLEKLEKEATDFNNKKFKIIHDYLKGNYFLFRNKNKDAIESYKKVLRYQFNLRDSIFLINTYGNLGALYETNLENPDSAIYYYNKKLELIEKSQSFGSAESYLNVYNNLGRAYLSKKEFNKARAYLIKASNFNTTKNKVFNELMIDENLAEVNAGINNFEEAYYNLKNVIKLSDSLKENEHQESIADIVESYDNKTLKANLEQKKIQQRNLWFGASILTLVLSVILYLVYKNAKRKQRISEQQREIESNKIEKLLKEQEIATIDAIIVGQEKERSRLASELHDSVGATLAAAKLQFSYIEKHKNNLENFDGLFHKTGLLLDDAYNEVRSMAHIKNSGVIAKNGLLPAVEKLAKNASGNNLNIEVQDFGLDERIENYLEITVFRIIQELVTNIIKHANASEATISITQHKDLLNIIIEDNGKGFNFKNIRTTSGMGLDTIERRVEHLEGTMEIDSTEGKGTTILIDIPL